MAVPDENTGAVLRSRRCSRALPWSTVGGPPINERPDSTGLFSDGRFLDFSHLRNQSGQTGNFQNQEQNRLHSSVSVSDDGRACVRRGTTAGFYILNSEAIATHRDAELEAGTAGCNRRSTIVSADGVINPEKISAVANDCLRMVINDDPGLKAYLASNASPDAKRSDTSC
jgi:hypothetical protein